MQRLRKSLQIFVVEDDEDDILIFSETCKDFGFLNVHFFDTVHALTRYAHSSGTTPELILLDLGQVIHGRAEMLVELTSDALLTTVPIVFVSGSKTFGESMKHQYPHLKIDRFLEKPITIEALEGQLRPLDHLFEAELQH